MVQTNVSRGGFIGIFRFMWRHWYMFWFIIIIIPMLITTINIAMKTDNPSYPFVNLGINIVGSDTS